MDQAREGRKDWQALTSNLKPWKRRKVLTIRMERKDLVARKSRSMAMFRAAEPPLAKGAMM